MLAIDYYHKLKSLYHKLTVKSQFIYIYTTDAVVTHVLFKSRKQKDVDVVDVPPDQLLLSRELNLPKDVIVQVRFCPLEFKLLEG